MYCLGQSTLALLPKGVTVFSMKPRIWVSCSVRLPCSSLTTLIGYTRISYVYMFCGGGEFIEVYQNQLNTYFRSFLIRPSHTRGASGSRTSSCPARASPLSPLPEVASGTTTWLKAAYPSPRPARRGGRAPPSSTPGGAPPPAFF